VLCFAVGKKPGRQRGNTRSKLAAAASSNRSSPRRTKPLVADFASRRATITTTNLLLEQLESKKLKLHLHPPLITHSPLHTQYAEEAKASNTVASDESSDEEDEVPATTATVTDPAQTTGTASDSVRNSLQQEIAELKKEKKKGAKATMATVETGCKGTCGISIPRNGPLSPVETCLRMLEEAKAGHSSTRCVAIHLFFA
jgi:hypothetical protein